MRRALFTLAAALLPATVLVTVQPAHAGPSARYVVLYGDDAAAARAAVRAIGGTVVRENSRVGVATVSTTNAYFFRDASRSAALAGVARDAVIGAAPQMRLNERTAVEQEGRGEVPPPSAGPIDRAGGQDGSDPLASLQWDMRMMDATPDGSYAVQAGDERVLVGIIDTGIDGAHPDVAPNFDAARSRNFTVDIPLVDGACADDPDGSCTDPANVDENGHGTHVASTVASPLNGLGMAGVAPNVTLVNLRAGQDSGYFFLQPTVDALTYAADIGVDVVNMSFYIDPWLYNCPNDATATPEEQLEQRTIIAATNRALDYAHRRKVTLVGSSGNSHTDLGNPTSDATSPDYPPGTERERTVDNTCLDMPTEGNHVLSVNAVGPTGIKADYSNYGLEQATVAAPGGFFRDYLGTPLNRRPENMILAAYPAALAVENHQVDENGVPTDPFVVRDCLGSTCAYYQWIQGTSMASPHVTGVIALIVSQYGHKDGHHHGELSMNPNAVTTILFETATATPCPEPRTLSYVPYGRSWSNTCEGTTEFNGFYGHGIVNALAAVGG